MKALTVWQPWASLIMAGAKPFEFRKWSFLERANTRALLNTRIVIHAGTRAIKPSEVEDILERLDTGGTSLKPKIARPILERLRAAYQCRGVLELGAGLGTAVLGKPRRIKGPFSTPDSDRVDQHLFAWSLTDIKPFDAPVHCRGFQGFWQWPFEPTKQERKTP